MILPDGLVNDAPSAASATMGFSITTTDPDLLEITAKAVHSLTNEPIAFGVVRAALGDGTPGCTAVTVWPVTRDEVGPNYPTPMRVEVPTVPGREYDWDWAWQHSPEDPSTLVVLGARTTMEDSMEHRHELVTGSAEIELPGQLPDDVLERMNLADYFGPAVMTVTAIGDVRDAGPDWPVAPIQGPSDFIEWAHSWWVESPEVRALGLANDDEVPIFPNSVAGREPLVVTLDEPPRLDLSGVRAGMAHADPPQWWNSGAVLVNPVGTPYCVSVIVKMDPGAPNATIATGQYRSDGLTVEFRVQNGVFEVYANPFTLRDRDVDRGLDNKVHVLTLRWTASGGGLMQFKIDDDDWVSQAGTPTASMTWSYPLLGALANRTRSVLGWTGFLGLAPGNIPDAAVEAFHDWVRRTYTDRPPPEPEVPGPEKAPLVVALSTGFNNPQKIFPGSTAAQDFARVKEAFNGVCLAPIGTTNLSVLRDAADAGLEVLIEWDYKWDFVQGIDITTRIANNVEYVRQNRSMIRGVHIADRLNSYAIAGNGRPPIPPEAMEAYLAASGRPFLQLDPTLEVWVDVEDHTVTCSQPGQMTCGSAGPMYAYENTAMLQRLSRTGDCTGFFIADNLSTTGSNPWSRDVQRRAWRLLREAMPRPFMLGPRTSRVSFYESANFPPPGVPGDAEARTDCGVVIPLEEGADAVDLWGWHIYFYAGELPNRWLNLDAGTNALWEAMKAAKLAHFPDRARRR